MATDQFIPLIGTPEAGYQPGTPEPLADLMSCRLDEWIEVDPSCTCQDDDKRILIEAGGGSWEGEGFVAVIDLGTGQLVWVLHLKDSEVFTKVRVDGAELVAVAEEYPIRNEFHIPLKEPHRLRVLSRYDL